jgi:hypothetical protein
MCLARKRSGIPRVYLNPQGMRMAKEKTKAIQEWQTPKSLRDVQSFLGFANFYRRVILGFSKICHPPTESTKGDMKAWEWTPDMEKAFVDLKDCFTTAPILTHNSRVSSKQTPPTLHLGLYYLRKVAMMSSTR